MILPEVRDPSMVTIRRGRSLTDEDHQLLALWAEHVLGHFEREQPDDPGRVMPWWPLAPGLRASSR